MTRFAAIAMAAAVAAQAAQQPPAGGGQVFRSGVDVTTIDVTVVARNGDPVPDLKADDFTVTVDGRPRTIVSAQFVGLGESSRVDSSAASAPSRASRDTHTRAPAAPPAVSSNRERVAGRGRLIVLLVDRGNIRMGAERSVMKSAEGFLDRLLPSDRIALLTIPTGPVVSFTGDRERVKAALRHIIGDYRLPAIRHNIAAVESLLIEDGDGETLTRVIERECAALDPGCPQEIELEARGMAPQVRTKGMDTIRALSDAFKFLKTIDGTKTVVMISEGLVLDQQRFPSGMPPEVEQLALQARATVYVLRLHQEDFDAQDVKPLRTIDIKAQTLGLETIAGATGGEVLTVVGTGASIFDRIARELSGQYLLGIETTDRDRDGKQHHIKVTVRRSRVDVRSRRTFEAAAPPPRSGELSAGTAILNALRSPILQTALVIRASSYTLLDADRSKVRLVVAAEVGEGYRQPTRLALGYQLTDAAGNSVAGHAGSEVLVPGPDGTLKYRQALSVAPGEYTLKLAAGDVSGRMGSVDRPIAAALVAAGPIAVADLVVEDERSGERGAALDVEPAVASGRVACAVDMRTAAAGLPGDSRVVFEIADAGDRVVASAPASLVSSEDGARHIARGSVDVSALGAGSYVARAAVTVSGQRTAEVSRPFRIAR